MIASDIKFYKPNAVDGGAITATLVESGVLHSLLTQINPSLAEAGGERYSKMFIKNTHVSDTALGADICMPKIPDGDDVAVIFLGTPTDTTSNFDNSKLYGIASATADLDRGTKIIPISTKLLNAVDVFASGDKITFISKFTNNKILKATIDTVSNTEIKVIEDIPVQDLNDTWIANTISLGDFASLQEQGLWIKQIIPPFASAMEAPADSLMVSVIFDNVV